MRSPTSQENQKKTIKQKAKALDSGIRRNDEQKRKHFLVGDAFQWEE